MRKVDIYRRFSDRRVSDNVHAVTAIVPNYNYADFIEERIDSIIHQTYPVGELIVLDDASSDHSVDVIKKKLSEIHDVRTKLIVNDTNSGSVFGQWQRGLKEASGDYFWICEADDSADPEFLETAMKGFEDPEVVLSYTDSCRIDDHNHVIRKNCQDLYNIFQSDHWNHPFITEGKDEIIHYLSVLNTILNVSGVVWKKQPGIMDVFEEAKNYRIAGDWYIYVRLLEKGKLAFSDRCLNYYRKHTGSVTSSVNADTEYREICRIQKMTAERYHVGMDIYRLQRFRRNLMDQNVSDQAHLKRIAWVIPYPGKGSGGHRTIIQNVNALIRKGYECDIYVADDGYSVPETVEGLIDQYYEPCAARVHIGFTDNICYDLVFATGWQTLDDVKKVHGRNRGYFIQDYEPWFFPVGNEYLLIEDSYRQGYNPITIGKWLVHKMQSDFHTPAQHFDFCADLDIYHPLKDVQKENAICYVWQPEKPRRGGALAIRALKIVKELRPDVRIYLYGSKEDEKIPFEAEKLGIISTDECNDLYNRCKVGLCLSASNPSRIPFEMMAAGLPVVELYRENNLYDMPDGGVLLAEASPVSIAAAVLSLLADDQKRSEMSEFGPDYMENFPLEKGLNQFTDAVDHLINGDTVVGDNCEKIYGKPCFTADNETRTESRKEENETAPVVNFRQISRTKKLMDRGLRKVKRGIRMIYHAVKRK